MYRDLECQCAIVTNNIQLKQQLREVNKMGGNSCPTLHANVVSTVVANNMLKRSS